MGGYDILGSGSDGTDNQNFNKRYDDLPSHAFILLKVSVYYIDSWDGYPDRKITIKVGSGAFDFYGRHYSYFTKYLCGSGTYPESTPFISQVSMAHTSLSLNLMIYSHSTEDSDSESFGFRDISIRFSDQSLSSDNFCQGSSLVLDQTGDNRCICGSSEYQTPPNSGTCYPCDNTCGTCSAGTDTDCKQCKSNEFLVNGVSCFPTCDDPLNQYLNAANQQACSTPCPNRFVFWDRSCEDSCLSILKNPIYNTFSLCTYPCADSEFLHWNGTCIDSCPLPLTASLYKGKKMCENPCPSSPIINYNRTCLSSCDTPLVIQSYPDYKVCTSPCESKEYLYPNGTCSTSCDSSMQATIRSSISFCDKKCDSPLVFFDITGECLISCPPGYSMSYLTKVCRKCATDLCSSCPEDLNGKCLACLSSAVLDTGNTCKCTILF